MLTARDCCLLLGEDRCLLPVFGRALTVRFGVHFLRPPTHSLQIRFFQVFGSDIVSDEIYAAWHDHHMTVRTPGGLFLNRLKKACGPSQKKFIFKGKM